MIHLNWIFCKFFIKPIQIDSKLINIHLFGPKFFVETYIDLGSSLSVLTDLGDFNSSFSLLFLDHIINIFQGNFLIQKQISKTFKTIFFTNFSHSLKTDINC